MEPSCVICIIMLMIYMFLDESGDLGFNLNKRGSSKYFLVTVILVKDKDRLHKIIRKIIRNVSGKNSKQHNRVLHAYKERPEVRKKLLNELNKDVSLKVFVIYINKIKISETLKLKKHTLYYRTIDQLLKYIYGDAASRFNDVNLILSKRETNKFLNNRLILQIKNTVKSNYKRDVNLCIESTLSNKGLQAVDMVSWSIFRKYEHKDSTYYDLIKDKIAIEIIFLE